MKVYYISLYIGNMKPGILLKTLNGKISFKCHGR